MGDNRKPSYYQKLLGRKAVRFSLLIVAVAVLLFILLQTGSKYFLRQWLLENGADSVAIEKMYLNPFTGRLTLNGVEIVRDGEPVYSDDILQFNISMRSLFDRDIHVEQAVLQDMLIDIHKDDSGALRIGSYRLPSEKKQETSKEDYTPWTMQAERIDLSNIVISYRQKGVNLQLDIDSGSARRLSSSINEESSRIMLAGNLNGAPLEFELSGFLLEPFFSVTGRMKLTDFSLQELEGFLSRQVSALSGTFSTAGTFSFDNKDEEHFAWRFDGTAETLGTALQNDDWSASGDLGWRGRISHENFSAEKATAALDGLFAGRSLRYREKDAFVDAGLQVFSSEGKAQLEMTEKVAFTSDLSISFSEVDAAAENAELSSTSASWQGTAEYVGSGDQGQKISTSGNIAVERLHLSVADTIEALQSQFTSTGKAEIVMADGLYAAYDGQSTAEGTDLTAGEFSLSSAGLMYTGLCGYESPEEAAAVAYVDGAFTAGKTGVGGNVQQLQWTQGKMAAEGDFKIKWESPPLFTGTAALRLEDGRLLEAEETAVTLDTLVVEQIRGDDSGNVSIPAVDGDSLALNSSASIPLSLAVEAVRLEEIMAAGMEKFEIGSTRFDALDIPVTKSQQFGIMTSMLEVSHVAGSIRKNLQAEAVRAEDILLPSVGGQQLDLSASVLEISQIASTNLKDLQIDAARVEDISLPSAGGKRLDLSASVLEVLRASSPNLKDLKVDAVRAEDISLPFVGEEQLGLWASELEISEVASNLENLAIAGITMQEISLPASGERQFAFALDSFRTGAINSGNLREYTVEVVELERPLLNNPNGERLLAMEDIRARQISGQRGRGLQVAQVTGRQADFLTRPSPGIDAPLASLAAIDASALSWSPEQGTHIESIAGDSLQGEYTRREGAGEPLDEQEEYGEDQDAAEIPLRIGRVSLSGSNQLKFSDPARVDPFTAVLTIDSLEIIDIDLADPEQSLTYEMEGYIDRYSPLTASGSAAPLADPRRWEQHLLLKGYPVENLSPFSIQYIGARLTGGRLALESELQLEGDSINMDNRLVMDEITTRTVEADRLRQFNNRLPVPLDTALGFMQEDGVITLAIPIEGKLSELDINYSDIIVTALSNSISSAVKPLLAYSVLGPGGVLAYLGMEIGQRLINTELPELTFDRNNADLTDEHKKALDEVGKRLVEKVKEQEDASFYIYPKVAPEEVSESGDAALLDEQQRQELYELGEERAWSVKSYLLQNFALEEDNLLLFQPGIVYDGESRGTISFMK